MKIYVTAIQNKTPHYNHIDNYVTYTTNIETESWIYI